MATARSNMRRLLAALLLVGALSVPALAAESSLSIPYTDVRPTLDDFLGMEVPPHLQGKLARTGPFIQREPDDGSPPTQPTEVYLAYDEQHLYAVFLAFDDQPQEIRANMSPRGNVFNDDNLNILIDTFSDQRRAYMFLANPLGIQFDAQYIEGGNFEPSFEAVWDSDGAVTDQGYVVVMAIPFRSLRYPDDSDQSWRVMFNRSIPRYSEESYWPRYTRAIEGRLNQTAQLSGIRDIRSGRNIQLIPFTFLRNVDVLDPEAGAFVEDDLDEDFGLDAKMVIQNSLVLDATINPDFSQVESDQPQVTVNQRFEVQFPEQRPFFKENSDVFRTPTNLVFTRRIVEPRIGAKLTGKRGPFQIGAMLIDDESPVEGRRSDALGDERAEIGILRLNRDLSEQSELGFLLTDRELADGYNRVAAIDGRIKVNDNWFGEFQVASAATRLASATVGDGERRNLDGMSYQAFFNREGTHLTMHNHAIYTSPDFVTQLGFLGSRQRPDAQNVHHRSAYRFRPSGSKLTEYGPGIFVGKIWDTDGEDVDFRVRSDFSWSWVGGVNLSVGFETAEEKLYPDEFANLLAPERFDQDVWSVEFDSRRSANLEFGVNGSWGDGINFVPAAGEAPELADVLNLSANALWRPIAPLRVNFLYLHTALSQPEGGRIFQNDIARVQGNWQFTKELSLRTIVQLNDTDPIAGRTSLERRRNVNVDLLVRYLWNPWTALYVGYNSNRSNLDLIDGPQGPELFRDPAGTLSQDGRQLFVKFSYLFDL